MTIKGDKHAPLALAGPLTEEADTEVGNHHGYLCPKCKKGSDLYITALVTAALLPEGVDTSNSDTEWDQTSPAWCGCGWSGTVGEFEQAEEQDESLCTCANRSWYGPEHDTACELEGPRA